MIEFFLHQYLADNSPYNDHFNHSESKGFQRKN